MGRSEVITKRFLRHGGVRTGADLRDFRTLEHKMLDVLLRELPAQAVRPVQAASAPEAAGPEATARCFSPGVQTQVGRGVTCQHLALNRKSHHAGRTSNDMDDPGSASAASGVPGTCSWQTRGRGAGGMEGPSERGSSRTLSPDSGLKMPESRGPPILAPLGARPAGDTGCSSRDNRTL